VPTAEDLRPQIEELARRYVAEELAGRDVHFGCKSSPTCLAAGPTDLDESLWGRFDADLLNRHFSPDADSTDRDDCCNALADAFSKEWQARVKPCK